MSLHALHPCLLHRQDPANFRHNYKEWAKVRPAGAKEWCSIAFTWWPYSHGPSMGNIMSLQV